MRIQRINKNCNKWQSYLSPSSSSSFLSFHLPSSINGIPTLRYHLSIAVLQQPRLCLFSSPLIHHPPSSHRNRACFSPKEHHLQLRNVPGLPHFKLVPVLPQPLRLVHPPPPNLTHQNHPHPRVAQHHHGQRGKRGVHSQDQVPQLSQGETLLCHPR